jgi:hypothetical protein
MCHITENVFSDLSKDIDGVRPRCRMEWFRGLTDVEQRDELKYLNSVVVALRAEAIEEKEVQARREFGPQSVGNAFSVLKVN